MNIYSDENCREWLRVCYDEASQGPDISTQIGAMIVGKLGDPRFETLSHNHPVSGWEMSELDWERPRKYQLLEHAERGAVYKAARLGLPLESSILISSWAACADCSRAIVECGISTLIRHYPPEDDTTERWLESVTVGDQILKAGGVSVIDIHGSIPNTPKILRGGTLFDPSGET